MITREEYELLKNYSVQGYSYLSRDKDNLLCVNMYEPRKLNERWSWGTNDLLSGRDNLKCVRWEDEKPTKIDDLIRDYESHQVIVGEKVKVTVPQFVADWIEGRKRRYTLAGLSSIRNMTEDVCKWVANDNENCEKIALAWIFGYEIEKEKLYTVDLNFNQALGKRNGVIKFYDPNEKLWIVERKLTKAEIESVNPILMQIAKEVE